MAVYTVLGRDEIAACTQDYGLGPLIDYRGITGGIENTNYFVTTEDAGGAAQHWVLTLFEGTPRAEIDFCVELVKMLGARGLPVPVPLENRNGRALGSMRDRPMLLVPRLPGHHPDAPDVEQCRALGHCLGHVHRACLEWPVSHPSIRSLAWLRQRSRELSPLLPAGERPLLDELDRAETLFQRQPDLPRAVIHGDLFRDNALFSGTTLTGLIDFYSAGDGFLMLDLAVVVNDWCTRDDGTIAGDRTDALLRAYAAVRSPTKGERQLWNDFLRLAALRFWVSRRYDELLPPAAEQLEIKDPSRFRNILQARIDTPRTWP